MTRPPPTHWPPQQTKNPHRQSQTTLEHHKILSCGTPNIQDKAWTNQRQSGQSDGPGELGKHRHIVVIIVSPITEMTTGTAAPSDARLSLSLRQSDWFLSQYLAGSWVSENDCASADIDTCFPEWIDATYVIVCLCCHRKFYRVKFPGNHITNEIRRIYFEFSKSI